MVLKSRCLLNTPFAKHFDMNKLFCKILKVGVGDLPCLRKRSTLKEVQKS